MSVLQSATASQFARTTDGSFEAPTNNKYVGTLNGLFVKVSVLIFIPFSNILISLSRGIGLFPDVVFLIWNVNFGEFIIVIFISYSLAPLVILQASPFINR